jgi:hypothetical protein
MKTKELDMGDVAKLLAEGPHGRDKQEKQAEAISNLQQTLMLMYKRQKPYEVPIRSEGNCIKFGVIGDTQIGSLYQQRVALTAYYERCAAEGVMTICHTGDVLDGWRVYRGQEFELRPDGKSWPEQKTLFINEMPKIAGMKTVFITGNHDASFKNLVGLVVGDELSQVRPDWKFIGQDVGDVDLKTPEGQIFKIRLLHPGGGTAYALSYRIQKIIESMAGGSKPDLLAVGHFHKGEYIPQYRNVAAIQSGCFQSQTPFMVRQSISAHVGGWIVTVHLNERRKLTKRIQAEWVGFLEEQN